MSDDETVLLKPCPFCGGNRIFVNKPASGAPPFVLCNSCFGAGPVSTNAGSAQAITAWNTRIVSPQTDGGVS